MPIRSSHGAIGLGRIRLRFLVSTDGSCVSCSSTARTTIARCRAVSPRRRVTAAAEYSIRYGKNVSLPGRDDFPLFRPALHVEYHPEFPLRRQLELRGRRGADAPGVRGIPDSPAHLSALLSLDRAHGQLAQGALTGDRPPGHADPRLEAEGPGAD